MRVNARAPVLHPATQSPPGETLKAAVANPISGTSSPSRDGPHGGGEPMAGRVALSRWTRLCIVVAALVGAFAAVLGARLGGPRTAQMVSDFGLCYASITAAVACVLRGHQF